MTIRNLYHCDAWQFIQSMPDKSVDCIITDPLYDCNLNLKELQQVFMVSEGWMSLADEDKPGEVQPSQDPDRKEVLIISAMQIKERKKLMKVFEIMRDSNEQVVSVEEFMPDIKEKDDQVDVPLLDAFVEGFQAAFRSRYN